MTDLLRVAWAALDSLATLHLLAPLGWLLAYFMLCAVLKHGRSCLLVMRACVMELRALGSKRLMFRNAMRALNVIQMNEDSIALHKVTISSIMSGARRCGMCSCIWCKLQYITFMMNTWEVAAGAQHVRTAAARMHTQRISSHACVCVGRHT